MTKVSEAIELIELRDQEIINHMVAKAGANGELTVDQLLALYPYTNPEVPREERLALLCLAHTKKNNFAPKLTFSGRCEVLALCRKGLPKDAIASAYNIDRRTVTHIQNPISTHYKKVREEELALGKDRFMETYLTSEIIDKVMAYIEKTKIKPVNSKHASGKAGVHTIKGEMCSYAHRVVIQWRENEEGQIPGWYYCDLDGEYPDRWFSSGKESLKTSFACYIAMQSEIADKMPGGMA